MVKLAEKLTATLSLQNYQAWLKEVYPYLLLLVISLPALVWRLDVYPSFWFDEGYKANTARTLAERGVYGTYTSNGYVPFDPGTSAGPVEIISAALSFKLLGAGVAQVRLVGVLFTLLALFSLEAIAVYLYGRRAGLFIMLFLLAAPALQEVSFLLMGRQFLGEGPALALVMLSLWLWFRSWENGRWSFSLLAGVTLGLGLLSKTQVSLALLPALALIVVGRGLKSRLQFSQSITPIVVTLAILAGWNLLGYLGTSESIRQENSLMLRNAIQSNLLTRLWGRGLTSSAWVMIAIMSMGVLGSGWRWLNRSSGAPFTSNRGWAQATLTLFVFFYILWFALLSVGWPRYAFMGLIVGLLLLGKLTWDIFQEVCRLIAGHWPQFSRYAYPTALVSLTLIAILTNLYPNLTYNEDRKTQQMADYIRQEIPREAVIESWAWELDALSSHWEYHHPHQHYLFLAIRQFSHEQKPFDLNYDLLQADPDYLITDTFSTWTHIYQREAIMANFSELTEIGTYRIYQRIR